MRPFTFLSASAGAVTTAQASALALEAAGAAAAFWYFSAGGKVPDPPAAMSGSKKTKPPLSLLLPTFSLIQSPQPFANPASSIPDYIVQARYIF